GKRVVAQDDPDLAGVRPGDRDAAAPGWVEEDGHQDRLRAPRAVEHQKLRSRMTSLGGDLEIDRAAPAVPRESESGGAERFDRIGRLEADRRIRAGRCQGGGREETPRGVVLTIVPVAGEQRSEERRGGQEESTASR